jgi:hypothetical protein
VKPNINKTGRIARGGISVVFLLAAAVLVPYSAPLALVFLLVGLFTLYEALRGWCAVRACGIKTPF